MIRLCYLIMGVYFVVDCMTVNVKCSWILTLGALNRKQKHRLTHTTLSFCFYIAHTLTRTIQRSSNVRVYTIALQCTVCISSVLHFTYTCITTAVFTTVYIFMHGNWWQEFVIFKKWFEIWTQIEIMSNLSIAYSNLPRKK